MSLSTALVKMTSHRLRPYVLRGWLFPLAAWAGLRAAGMEVTACLWIKR